MAENIPTPHPDAVGDWMKELPSLKPEPPLNPVSDALDKALEPKAPADPTPPSAFPEESA